MSLASTLIRNPLGTRESHYFVIILDSSSVIVWSNTWSCFTSFDLTLSSAEIDFLKFLCSVESSSLLKDWGSSETERLNLGSAVVVIFLQISRLKLKSRHWSLNLTDDFFFFFNPTQVSFTIYFNLSFFHKRTWTMINKLSVLSVSPAIRFS